MAQKLRESWERNHRRHSVFAEGEGNAGGGLWKVGLLAVIIVALMTVIYFLS